jgi:hypothetical protein
MRECGINEEWGEGWFLILASKPHLQVQIKKYKKKGKMI